MKKETAIGIAKWLKNGNTGLSSENVLMSFLSKGEITNKYIPFDWSDFNRIATLIEFAPEVKKGVWYLRNKNESWKNINKFWDELIYLWKNASSYPNRDFYDFLQAVNNKLYGNTNYQKNYDERQAKGREIYNSYGFKGKRLPKAPKSY